jgi:hypothetical protein
MNLIKKFDPRLKMGLTFVVTLLMLILSFELGMFRWEDRSDKYSALDLVLVPIGLAAGLTVGVYTGRWRFAALQQSAHGLAGRIFFREKSVFALTYLGQKVLKTEKDTYFVLIATFLLAMGVTGAYFMPAGAAACFVLGIHLTGQTVPYFRLWRWQSASGATTDLDVPQWPERTGANDSSNVNPQSRLDPRLRIALTLAVLIPCLALGWSLWGDRSDKTVRLDLTLVPIGLAVGLALGAVTGRWRFAALQELLPLLSGTVLFSEPHVLSRSEPGKKALMTEKLSYVLLVIMFLTTIAVRKPAFIPIGTAGFFILGLWFTSQAIPYFRFWLNQRRKGGWPGR